MTPRRFIAVVIRVAREIAAIGLAVILGPFSGIAFVVLLRWMSPPEGGHADGANKGALGMAFLVSTVLFTCGSVVGYGIARLSNWQIRRAMLAAVVGVVVTGAPLMLLIGIS